MKCQKNIGLTIEYYFWRIILGSDEEGGNTVDNFSPGIEQSLSRDGFTNKGLSCQSFFQNYSEKASIIKSVSVVTNDFSSVVLIRQQNFEPGTGQKFQEKTRLH